MNFSDYNGKGYDDYFSFGDYIDWQGHIYELRDELENTDFLIRKYANDWGCGLNVYNDYLKKMDLK